MFEGRTGFLTGNLVLDLSILAWFLAQLIKTVANLVVNRNLDLKRMVGSGDMPSSHSSFICAATASIGQIYGWQAPLFSLAAVGSASNTLGGEGGPLAVLVLAGPLGSRPRCSTM